MVDLYIYYQVPAAHAQQLAPRIRAMQGRLTLQYGISCQLKRRLGERDGLQTWMEIYHATKPGFDEVLAAALRETGIAELIEGDRHTEVFTDLNSCA